MPAMINIAGVPDWMPTLASLIVAIVIAFEGIFRPREHWRNYDTIAAELRSEEMMYSTKTGPYQEVNAFDVLVKRVEDLIAAERAATIVMRTTPLREVKDLDGIVPQDSKVPQFDDHTGK